MQYPCRSDTAPNIFNTNGHPCDNVSPELCNTCNTHSNCRCLTSPCKLKDNCDSGLSNNVCSLYSYSKKNQ